MYTNQFFSMKLHSLKQANYINIYIYKIKVNIINIYFNRN